MNEIKPKRQRSPGFPYLTLSDCIELASKLHSAANTGYARIADIAEHWSVTAFSGSHLRYVSSMSEYQLVETKGSGKDRQIKLTDEAVRILEDEREGIRESLLAVAALKPRMVNKIFNGSDKADFSGWGFLRPSDSIAISTLKFDFKFTSDGAKKFLSIYDDCLKYLSSENELTKEIDNAIEADQPNKLLKAMTDAIGFNPPGEASVEPETKTNTVKPIKEPQASLISFDMKTISISGTLVNAEEVKKLISDLEKLVALMPD